MREPSPPLQIAVLGSADPALAEPHRPRLDRLGEALAARGVTLLTGGSGGVGEMVARAARRAGGLVCAVSPAGSPRGHAGAGLAGGDTFSVCLCSGFGTKGRNVLLVRSADAVIAASGEAGTLNELTIAYDEERPIGLLAGSGGAADLAPEIFSAFTRHPELPILAREDPEALVRDLLSALPVGRAGPRQE